jgi:cytochrome b6-f complex iron-sulfur subunit
MMLELLAATALALVAVAWWLRRAALRPVPVRARATTPPRSEPPCAGSAMLMAAPPDVSGAAAPAQTGEPASSPAPARKPPKRKASGPDRRTFLKWSMGLGWVGVLASFGAASLAFIWPNLRGGFGARIPIGSTDEILGEIDANEGRFEFPEGRSLVVKYDPAMDPEGVYADITNQTGIMALYQRCVHLGCKVPWCAASQWWECPCHGSKYNRWGEWQEGPAARGLDRFLVEEVEGQVVVDTSTVITGPPRTAAVLDQPPEGPHCQDAA